MPNSVRYLDWMLAFEWYANKSGFDYEYQEYTCSIQIGLHIQHMRTTLGSIVNCNGGGLMGGSFNEHNILYVNKQDIYIN